MIGAGFGRDTEPGAKERSPEFGNQFLHGVSIVAKPLAKLTIATLFV